MRYETSTTAFDNQDLELHSEKPLVKQESTITIKSGIVSNSVNSSISSISSITSNSESDLSITSVT